MEIWRDARKTLKIRDWRDGREKPGAVKSRQLQCRFAAR
jgi:hypothetical protein